MIDLENFPTSGSAKRMMKTVSPIYDKAYVAKWIFQVMGAEVDETWQFYNELRLQAFPETATWGISYWEQRYHIAPDESLTTEERRQRVIVKRGKRAPMNAARLEQFTKDITGRSANVTEQNGEYTFTISILPGDSTVDYQALIDLVKSVKPSHLAFKVIFEVGLSLVIRTDNEKWAFGYTLTGTEPDTNTLGALGDDDLILDAGIDGYPFEYALSGTGTAGEEPSTNTLGDINDGSILPSIAATGSAFSYQLCGDAEREL